MKYCSKLILPNCLAVHHCSLITAFLKKLFTLFKRITCLANTVHQILTIVVIFPYCVVYGHLDLLVDIFPEFMVLWHEGTDSDYEENFIRVVWSFCGTNGKVLSFFSFFCMVETYIGFIWKVKRIGVCKLSYYKWEHTVIVEAQHLHSIRNAGRSIIQQSCDSIEDQTLTGNRKWAVEHQLCSGRRWLRSGETNDYIVYFPMLINYLLFQWSIKYTTDVEHTLRK